MTVLVGFHGAIRLARDLLSVAARPPGRAIGTKKRHRYSRLGSTVPEGWNVEVNRLTSIYSRFLFWLLEVPRPPSFPLKRRLIMARSGKRDVTGVGGHVADRYFG